MQADLKFRVEWYAVLNALAWWTFAVCGVAVALDPSLTAKGLFILVEVVCVSAAVRAWRGATVILDNRGVTVRQTARTRLFAWQDIAQARIVRGSSAVSSQWRVLAIELRSGKVRRFQEIRAKSASSAILESVAEAINTRVERGPSSH